MQGSAMRSGGQLANLNRVLREDLNEKITSKQKLEGGEVAPLGYLGKEPSVQRRQRTTPKCNCSVWLA